MCKKIQIKLHAGSMSDKFLGLYPPGKKYCGGIAYIVTIEDEQLRFDIYCEDVLLEPMQNETVKLIFNEKSYIMPCRKIENTLSAAMEACNSI